jgi:hypothetical protein
MTFCAASGGDVQRRPFSPFARRAVVSDTYVAAAPPSVNAVRGSFAGNNSPRKASFFLECY